MHCATPAGVRPELAERRARLLEELLEGVSALRELFELVVPFGVGVHHAGLAMQEREHMEAAFRCGTIRAL